MTIWSIEKKVLVGSVCSNMSKSEFWVIKWMIQNVAWKGMIREKSTSDDKITNTNTKSNMNEWWMKFFQATFDFVPYFCANFGHFFLFRPSICNFGHTHCVKNIRHNKYFGKRKQSLTQLSFSHWQQFTTWAQLAIWWRTQNPTKNVWCLMWKCLMYAG